MSFLHFHEDPAGLFADVRKPDGGYSRMQVDTLQQQDAALLAVGKLLGVPLNRRSSEIRTIQ